MYLVDAFAREMSASVAPAEQAQRAPDESGPIRFRYGVVSVPVF
jgi:hypothetical protein